MVAKLGRGRKFSNVGIGYSVVENESKHNLVSLVVLYGLDLHFS